MGTTLMDLRVSNERAAAREAAEGWYKHAGGAE
jgi:hypothetical protein